MAEKPVDKDTPRRFRLRYDQGGEQIMLGCYFPKTDLAVYETGQRSTGAHPDVEWIDPIPEHLAPKDPTNK